MPDDMMGMMDGMPGAGPAMMDLPLPFTLPKRATRSLKVDKAEVVESVLQRLRDDLEDRSEWMENHLRRYAKYRGWTEQKAWQFEDASNAHLPITMYSCQRMEDTLYSGVMGQPLIMQAAALQSQDVPKERRVTQVVHDQLSRFARFPQIARELIHNLVVDGTVHVMIPWIRGTQTIREFARIPAPPPGSDLLTSLMAYFRETYGEEAEVEQAQHRFTILTPQGVVDVEAYVGSDGDIEIIESREMRFDHVGLKVEDLEDIVVPPTCTNPQPPTEANPGGAHHVFRLCTPLHLDAIKRRKQQGLYDLLTSEDLTVIEQWADQAPTAESRQPKEQKDEIEGVASQAPIGTHQAIHVIEAYDRYDVNGDGFEEDVIFTVLTNEAYEEGRLARARYLTEVVPPGLHGARRPIEKFVLFQETNRYYGISLPELVEGSQDIMNTLFNFGVDAGVISNMPFFFYRAASGLKSEVIKLNPMEGYPLDDPNADIRFPQLPGMQGSWMFNELAMINQFLEKLTMQSALSFGGVPQGKSSALRTSGNMQSVLGQGDMRIDRVLRQLMEGLAQIWDQALALCQRYLPPMTEYRLLGYPNQGETFDRVTDRSEIAGRFRFTWTSTVANTNPMMKQQAATSLMQVVANPLMLQAQLSGPEEIYRAARKFIEALDEPNPDLYLRRPPTGSSGPKLTAAQAISTILGGQPPAEVNPIEPLQQHAQALMTFMQSDEFGLLTPQQVQDFSTYFQMVIAALQQQFQQMQMMQAAQQFQQMMGGGPQNGTGGPTPGPPGPQATSLSPTSPAEAGMAPQGNAPQGMPMGGMV